MDQTGYRLAYACQSCGFLAEAQVIETGRKPSRSAAKRTLALSACPTCSWRDPVVRRKFLVGSVARVLLGSLLPLAVTILAAVAGQPSLALSAALATVVAGWFIYALRVRPLVDIADRVRFLSSGEIAIRSRISSRKLKKGRTTSTRLRAVVTDARSRSTSR